MSQVYSRTVKAIGDVEAIYDRLCATVRAKGFNVITTEKPNLIVAERGYMRPTFRVAKFPHSIVIAFHAGESNPQVSFSYIMSDMWDYTQGDRDYLNEEINSLVASLNMNFSTIEMKMTSETVVPSSASYIGELRGLARLRDDGVISAADYDMKKRQLMGI
jgi:hypothetical protein